MIKDTKNLSHLRDIKYWTPQRAGKDIKIFEDVIAETDEEKKDIERIINEVKEEDKLPIDFSKLTKGIPAKE